ncbi:MAG: hypothetical protein AAFX92_10760 [Pseudomonadota bacterium]
MPTRVKGRSERTGRDHDLDELLLCGLGHPGDYCEAGAVSWALDALCCRALESPPISPSRLDKDHASVSGHFASRDAKTSDKYERE